MPAPLSGARPALCVTILLTTVTVYNVASRYARRPLPLLLSLSLSLSLSRSLAPFVSFPARALSLSLVFLSSPSLLFSSAPPFTFPHHSSLLCPLLTPLPPPPPLPSSSCSATPNTDQSTLVSRLYVAGMVLAGAQVLISILSTSLNQISPDRRTSNQALVDLFARFDVDGNGLISESELDAVLDELKMSREEKKLVRVGRAREEDGRRMMGGGWQEVGRRRDGRRMGGGL
eukprot:2612236-Rhodomonas_salina.1